MINSTHNTFYLTSNNWGVLTMNLSYLKKLK